MSVVQEAASLDHIRQALLTLLSPDAPGMINESTKTRQKKRRWALVEAKQGQEGNISGCTFRIARKANQERNKAKRQ